MGVGAVPALGADAHRHPAHRLLGEAQGVDGRRLRVQQAVAQHLAGQVPGQVVRAPPAAGFLVRHDGQGQAARQGADQPGDVEVGEQRGGGAGLHVHGAAAPDPAAVQLAAQRVPRPARAVADGEHVEVAVQHQVPARRGPGHAGDQVRLVRVGRHGAERQPRPVQRPSQQVRAAAGVAGRVAGVDAGEVLQEADQAVAVPLDPAEQRLDRHHAASRSGGLAR